MYYLNGLGCGKSCPCDSCKKAEQAESMSGIHDKHRQYRPAQHHHYQMRGLGIPAPSQEQIGWKGSLPGPIYPGEDVGIPFDTTKDAVLHVGIFPELMGPPGPALATKIDQAIKPTPMEKNALDNVIKWSWDTPAPPGSGAAATGKSAAAWKGIPFPTAPDTKKLSWFDSLSPDDLKSLAVSVPMSAAILQGMMHKRKKGKKLKQQVMPQQEQGMSWTSMVMIGIGVVVVGGLVFGGYKKFKKK